MKSSPSHRLSLSLSLSLSPFLISSAALADGNLTVATGFDYSTGKYGSQESTRILVLPVSARWEQGSWLAKLTVPYLEIHGGAGGMVGSGDSAVVLSGRNKGDASGLGDVVASLGYSVWHNRDHGVDLVAKLKLPTADEAKGLGTGKQDESLQLDTYHGLGQFSLFSTLGYRWMGKPDGRDYRNIAYATLGGGYALSDVNAVGLMFDFRQAVTRNQSDQGEWTLYLSHKIDPHWKAQIYAYTGTTSASPDQGLGLQFSYRY